jgi:wyosine [tRNA(Phe)-imidazoG37] synthetase (radical SAM superfamily)
MQGAVRDVIPVRGICMLERAYNFSAHFKADGAHAPQCTNDCLYCHTTRRKLKLQTAYDPQREILRMRAKSACVIKPA